MAADDTSKIAHRYAEALFRLADDAKALEAVEGDLHAFKKALAASAELARLLSGPLLPRHGKAALADAILERLKAHELTRKFARRLAYAGRFEAFSAIMNEFDALMTAHRGEIVLEVVTPKPADVAALTAEFAKAYGRKVQVHASVDPSLIAGMIVKTGGLTMDYSMKNRLARLSRSLKTQAA